MRYVLICLLLVNAIGLKAQFNGHNLLETQYGKLPSDTTAAFATIYDRAVIDYRYKGLKAGITIEQFYSKYKNRNYFSLQQSRLQYSVSDWEVNVGNFYETIGRGLLLRSYQIQGAILEDLSYRSRHYFHRDILGANVKYQHKRFSIKTLYGLPLNYVYPPGQGFDYRRPDAISAIYSDYQLGKQTIGAAVMHLKNESNSDVYAMFTGSGSINQSWSYYVETAKNVNDYSVFDFGDESPFAFYVNSNLAFENLGVSLEYKYYNNFVLGAGFNEPPALVKEHSYRLLNRSTHVLQPLNEQGYQVEAFYHLTDATMLTFNHSLAINDFAKKYVFQEYFMEYSTYMNDKHDLKLFIDYSEDPFKSEMQRITVGAYAQWRLSKSSGLKTEWEWQCFDRSGTKIQNLFGLLGYNYKSTWSISMVGELSNDNFIVEDKKPKLWLGSNVKYKVNNKNTILLFAGQRRGGPACNSGVCYEVLDFEGVELRLTSRF